MRPSLTVTELNNPLVDTLVYLVMGGVLHSTLLVVVLLLVSLSVQLFAPQRMFAALRWSLWSVGILFLVGLGGHLYWSTFIWNTVYWSPDYVVDFWMFFPANETTMSPAGWDPGHLIGASTLGDISASWRAVASVCWVVSLAFILSPKLVAGLARGRARRCMD